MNPTVRDHIKTGMIGSMGGAYAPKEPACRSAAGYTLMRAGLLVQARSSSLDVNTACAAELFHAFHLLAGDVHVIAAVNDTLGQQQIRIGRHKGAGNPSLVQGAQQLLGSDYPSVDVGKTFMHSFNLPFSSSVHTAPLDRMHSKHDYDTIQSPICQ